MTYMLRSCRTQQELECPCCCFLGQGSSDFLLHLCHMQEVSFEWMELSLIWNRPSLSASHLLDRIKCKSSTSLVLGMDDVLRPCIISSSTVKPEDARLVAW